MIPLPPSLKLNVVRIERTEVDCLKADVPAWLEYMKKHGPNIKVWNNSPLNATTYRLTFDQTNRKT